MKRAIIFAVALCLVAGIALAADFGGVSGTVTEVDTTQKTVKFKKGEQELILRSPNEKIMFVQSYGTVDDLVEGKEANVDGKISEDQTSIESKSMILYPGTGRGGQRFIRDVRADGLLKKKDGQWYVSVKDKDVRIDMAPKYRVLLRDNYTLDKVEAGDRIEMYAAVEGDEVQKPSYIAITKKK